MNPPDRLREAVSGVGDDTLASWMSQYGPALRRYFARRVGQAEADDLVQEVFLKLQRSAPEAEVRNVEALLFTVARRVLLNRYQTSTSDPLARSSDDLSNQADDISPERILEGKQAYERAIVAISGLPPRMRMAFMLHRFGKLSFSAIAEQMGVSKSTVQALMERALERVMDELEDEQ